MTARRHLSQVEDLTRLQRAERDAASGDVAEARAHETAAIADERAATLRAAGLVEQWYAMNAGTLLNPETSAALGRLLVDAETAADVRSQEKDVASRRYVDAIETWREHDARHRATCDLTKTLTRQVARLKEEAALMGVADRTTTLWRHE